MKTIFTSLIIVLLSSIPQVNSEEPINPGGFNMCKYFHKHPLEMIDYSKHLYATKTSFNGLCPVEHPGYDDNGIEHKIDPMPSGNYLAAGIRKDSHDCEIVITIGPI